MTASTISMEHQVCFQFKASFAPCTILQLSRYDLAALEQQLAEAIRRAPNFFIGSPVLIDLEKINTVEVIDFSRIKQIVMSHGLAPMGVRGGNEGHMIAAATAGLPQVNIGKSSKVEQKQDVVKEKTEAPAVSATRIITTPIRSGMQIYARGGDLVVIAPVSPGAELMADGHIHVYGPLRGRALAGVQGNTEARIFCSSLEAELVSIAGFYVTKDEMQIFSSKQEMIQIYLEREHVKISRID